MGSQPGTQVMKICLILLFAIVSTQACTSTLFDQVDCCNPHIPTLQDKLINPCIYRVCKQSPCCHHTKAKRILSASPPETEEDVPRGKTVFVHESSSSPSSDEEKLNEGCWPSCFHRCQYERCKNSGCCNRKGSESSPSDLVNGALGQLKAGNTLKLDVNIRNPQAIMDKAEAADSSPKSSHQFC